MVTFSYINPKEGVTHSLNLRLDPYAVDWTYTLNTQSIDTYAGQVIQILSVKIDTLTIQGQFGKEGPFGKKQVKAGFKDRNKFTHTTDGLAPTDIDEQWNVGTGPYAVGLTQMTEFFRTYFAISAQGSDAQADNVSNRYLQIPMTLSYPGRTWGQIIPSQFPSYKRANDNFAPEWRVISQVVEAPTDLLDDLKNSAIDRLNSIILPKDRVIRNPFSDPLVSLAGAERNNAILVNKFKALLPEFTTGELQDMFWKDITLPAAIGGAATPGVTGEDNSDYLDGEDLPSGTRSGQTARNNQ
jgi:hypothetical protein